VDFKVNQIQIQIQKTQQNKVHGRSLIAGVNALFREMETNKGEEAILEDHFATYFAERGGVVLAINIARFFLPPLNRVLHSLQTVHNIRHCAIDHCVMEAFQQGCRQFVILGAGYDMRPFRFPEIRKNEDCLWVELDNPATAERKIQLLKTIPNLEIQCTVKRIQARFEERGLNDLLEEAEVKQEQAVCFILEGLIHYQSEDDFHQMSLQMLQGDTHREIILSFITPKTVEKASKWQRKLFTWVREIPKLFFSPKTLQEHFISHKCNFFQHWGYDEQVSSFAPQAGNRPIRTNQDVAHIARRV
jgi:methyltransferase (TIGR00027 family)